MSSRRHHVGRVVVRGAGAVDGAHARPGALRLLETAELDRDLAPAATLVVRTVAARATPAAIEAGVAAARARAARPALGPVPAGAPAVLFADDAELLACLARDLLSGVVGERWWWRAQARPQTAAATVVARTWARSPTAVPAAIAELARDAVPALEALGPDGRRVVATAVAEAGVVAEAVLVATACDAAPLAAVLGAAHPPRAGRALAGSPTTSPDRSPRSPQHEREPRQAQAAATRAGPAPAARTAGAGGRPPEPVHRGVIARVPPSAPPVADGAQPDPPRPVDAPRRPVEAHAAPGAAGAAPPGDLAPPGPAAPAAPPSLHAVRAAATATTPAAPVPAPSSLRRPVPVRTRLGGAFLLVGVALDLGLFPDFTRPLDQGHPEPLPLWLRHVAAHLAGARPDPLWELLAELGGGDGRPPGRAGLRADARRVRRRLGGLEVVRRRGEVHLAAGRVDVVLELAELDVEIRLAGLDRDPGWLPSAGLDLRFHFR